MSVEYRASPDEIKQTLNTCVDEIFDAVALISSVADQPDNPRAQSALAESLAFLRAVTAQLTRISQ